MTQPVAEAKPEPIAIGLLRDSLTAVGSTRISDALLMSLFVVRTDLLGVGFTINDLAGLALVVLAMFRRPVRSLQGVRWYLWICAVILSYLALVALLTGLTAADITRFGRITIMMLLAAFIASGRIDIVSGLKGFTVGLLANIPLFYAGLAPDEYGGLLTGFLGDKNVAGLTYAVMTVLLLVLANRTSVRIFIVAAGAGAVVLTDSRTSIAALAAAMIWLVISRYLGAFFRVILAGLLYWAFVFVETNFSQVGDYAKRSGSDELRERIDAASLEKTIEAPWYGHGLGQATAEVAGDTWFFHNAYWGLITEGGYPLLVLFLALIAFAGFQFFAKGPASLDARIIEAATVVILLCAFRLGEVFITQPTFIMIGLGLSIAARRHEAWKLERHQELVTAPAVALSRLQRKK